MSLLKQKFNYLPLTRSESSGKRLYECPDGSKVPSVTTILSATKSQESIDALANWRKNVGEQKAQQISTEAANRGTRMHKYLEDFVSGIQLKESVSNPYAQQSLTMAKKIIEAGFPKIDEVWGVEVPVFFPELYAGVTDCVGVHDGQESILDYKQSNKPKKLEYIEDYFVQLTGYALAHNEVYGTNIQKGVILMCVKPDEISPGTWGVPQYQEFILEPKDFDYWTDKWCDRVSKYYRQA